MPERPNLLYIFADQHTHHAMSCAGNHDLHTPNMDALAARGVRFTNAYCAFPLCTPSRVSMLSGKMPSQLGCSSNHITWPTEAREHSLGHVLNRAGYTCAWGGKWHAGGDGRGDGPDHGFGFEKLCGQDDAALPQAAAEFIRRDHAQPFCLVLSVDNPHNICQHGRDQSLPWGEVEDGDLPESALPGLPANFPETAYEPQVVRLYKRSSPKTQMQPEYSPARWRRYRHAYYRLVEMVDTLLGRVLAALEDAGYAENTVVIYTSDHGEMAGAHETSHKNVLYRESVGVPLIVADPRGSDAQRGYVSDALINNGIDLLPTLCDYADAEAPAGLQGKSWRPIIEGHAEVLHDRVMAETALGTPAGAHSGASGYDGLGWLIRTRDYTYHCYNWGQHREQLFDIDHDPGEMVNLAVQAKHRDTLNAHRRLLAEHMQAVGHTLAGEFGYGPHSIPGIGSIRPGIPPS